jgi:tRNA threonylcarbamoyladenosine biosynthesis protein TsaB
VILSLDTTSEFGSLALVDASGVIAEMALESTDGFGHVLFVQLEVFLKQEGITLEQIECFAAASGPGSFTGVRVGLAAIKGLAEATGRLALGVSNLQTLAWFGSAPLRAVVLDARRGEVYGAVYDSDLKLTGTETVSKLADWLRGLPSGELEFISTDFTPFQHLVDPDTPVITVPRELATAVGSIAWSAFTAGRAVDPAAIDANYVRRSDAELFWRE